VKKWQGGRVKKWQGGRVKKWQGGRVKKWQGGRVEKWQGGRVKKWQGGRVAKSSGYDEGGVKISREQNLMGLYSYPASGYSSFPLCCPHTHTHNTHTYAGQEHRRLAAESARGAAGQGRPRGQGLKEGCGPAGGSWAALSAPRRLCQGPAAAAGGLAIVVVGSTCISPPCKLGKEADEANRERMEA
jgi:hypothetical protein